jgi:hypothetical protein
MADTIETRVAQGVALLDEKLPGWVNRIDLDKLDLASTCDCILGQEFKGHPDVDMEDDGNDEGWPTASPFDIGVRELFVAAQFTNPEHAARSHGFNASSPSLPGEFAALTAGWKRVVLARRAVTA